MPCYELTTQSVNCFREFSTTSVNFRTGQFHEQDKAAMGKRVPDGFGKRLQGPGFRGRAPV
jgi:hypothetical protein